MFTSVPRTAMAAEVCRSEPKSRNLLLGSWDRWCMSSRLIEPRTFCPFPDPPCTTVIIMKRKWTLHSQSRLTSSVKSMACVDQRKKVRRGSFSFSRKWPTMGGHFFFFCLRSSFLPPPTILDENSTKVLTVPGPNIWFTCLPRNKFEWAIKPKNLPSITAAECGPAFLFFLLFHVKFGNRCLLAKQRRMGWTSSTAERVTLVRKITRHKSIY